MCALHNGTLCLHASCMRDMYQLYAIIPAAPCKRWSCASNAAGRQWLGAMATVSLAAGGKACHRITGRHPAGSPSKHADD